MHQTKLNKLKSAQLASAKLARSFRKTPEHQLFLAVVDRAIVDLDNPLHAHGARVYLDGTIVHAEACGIDSDYVRRILKTCGLDTKNENRE